ncbi:Protein SERAC1 [Colletotrichum fructicola]|nr:Protein SERAC1 [Colletotrichum fructicola]KAF4928434.1 Protein SERAC1 [Colletotrichum fructicola]
MKWLSSRFRNADRNRPQKPPSGLPEPLPDQFPSGIKLLHSPDGDVLVDIVFVHGLTGNREKTWTAHGATEPWPKMLLPAEIPDARILTFGYDADVVNLKDVVSTNRIANHSWKLLTDLARVRENDETNNRPIIFVCHSLGGLVCEDALVTSRYRPNGHLQAIVNSTRGIVFLGTPHHGAGLAIWADHFLKWISIFKQTNKSIVKTLRRDSEVLARIQDSFHTIIQSRNRDTNTSIEITCFFEELPIPGVGLVVPQDSAVIPGYIPIGIHSNHQDMARFANGDDSGFKSVCAELQRWMKGLRSRRNEAAPATLSHRPNMMTELSHVELQAGRGAHFMVRGPKNCNFVGRSQILDRLKEEFGHGARCKVFGGRSRACLYGLGGVGKTQIALQYVYWLHETRPDFSIFWVHASSEARFRQSFEDIAEECDIPGRHAPSVNVLSLVQTWLRQQLRHPWLLVLDNADDEFLFYPKSPSSAGSFATKYENGNGKQGLGHFIPECGQGCVLVTTRNKQAGLDLVFGQPIIEVERMDDEESARMISAMTGAKDLLFSKSSTLSNRLENLPLALAQLSAFISRNSITVDRYLELLDESDRNFVSLLCQDFTAVGRDSEIPPAVMLTWVVSFEQIDLQYPDY